MTCVVVYNPQSGWLYGGESVPWNVTDVFAAADLSSPVSARLKTSDGWVVARLEKGGTWILTRCADGLVAFARGAPLHYCDGAEIPNVTAAAGVKFYRATTVDQVGNGMPFTRAVLVTPLGDDGEPTSPHPFHPYDGCGVLSRHMSSRDGLISASDRDDLLLAFLVDSIQRLPSTWPIIPPGARSAVDNSTVNDAKFALLAFMRMIEMANR
ncbi:hypothetical protein PENTCL1PPCAC_11478, partial [Pristionchus entomophagus]